MLCVDVMLRLRVLRFLVIRVLSLVVSSLMAFVVCMLVLRSRMLVMYYVY